MADLNKQIRNNPFAPPTMQPNPLMPPMPPPPPGPEQGFQNWASSAANAMKVQPAMTSPSSPLQPNAQGPMSAIYNPPGAPKPLPTQEQDQAANPGAYGKPVMGTKVGAGLTIAASALAGAAGGMKGNPGAGLEYAMKVKAADDQIGQDNTDTYNKRIVQPSKDALSAANTQSEIEARKAKTTLADKNYQASLAKNGLKTVADEQGNVSIVQDEDSPAFKSQQQKQELLQAQVENAKAQKELRDAQTSYERAKTDPNSPLFKQTAQRLAIAQQNAAAAGKRAEAYMGNYLMHSQNVDLNGNVLNGAPVIQNEDGKQAIVGTSNAGTAIKNQSNAAQFNDVHGAIDSLEGAANALVTKGGKLNSPGIVTALSQPAGTLGKWLQGETAKKSLTPEERSYVTALNAAHENVQALRKSAGGSSTDSSVAKLDALIPDASTPDIDYLKRQTDQIRQTAKRLGLGATTSVGGLTVKGRTPTPASPHPFTPPTQTGKASTGGYKVGQTVTLKNGQKVIVKKVYADGSFE